jgi:hypothetical protein
MSSSTLVLDVTHSKRPLVFREVRFQPDWTLEHVKKKLEVVTGTLHSDFLIEVYDDRGQKVGEMVDDQQATLGSFPIRSNYRLHVVDHREEDDSEDRIWREEEAEEVPKYQVPEESYAQREGSCRNCMTNNVSEQSCLVSGRKFREEMLQAKASHSTNIELHVSLMLNNSKSEALSFMQRLAIGALLRLITVLQQFVTSESFLFMKLKQCLLESNLTNL